MAAPKLELSKYEFRCAVGKIAYAILLGNTGAINRYNGQTAEKRPDQGDQCLVPSMLTIEKSVGNVNHKLYEKTISLRLKTITNIVKKIRHL